MSGQSFAERRRAAGIATSDAVPIVILPPPGERRERLCPALDKATESDLVRRFLAGDRQAGERLLRAHHGAIQSKAKRLARRCSLLEESDLVQVGRMGFFAALRTFDLDGDGALWSYVEVAVFRAMSDAIDEEDGTIYVPPAQQRAIRRALKTGGLDAKLQAIDMLRRCESVDEPVAEDDDRTMLDMLSRRGTPEDALLALEEINLRPRVVAWRPDRQEEAAEDRQREQLRVASRGRVAA